MNELIAAATKMCNTITAYYEKQLGAQELPLVTTIAVSEPMVDAPARTRKPRTPKAEVATPAVPPVPAPVASAAPAVLDEKGSEDRLKAVGEAFVQRFSKQGDAVAEVSKLLGEKYKIARLRDLTHPQRLDLIATLEVRIKEIDSRPVAAPSVAAPAGLGL